MTEPFPLRVGLWATSTWDHKLQAKVVPWAHGHHVGFVYIFEGQPDRNFVVYMTPSFGGGTLRIHRTGPVDYMVSGRDSIIIDPELKVDPDNDEQVGEVDLSMV